MLLRVEDLSAISGLTISNAFVLGNEIVCVSKSLGHDWQMYALNSETFAVRKLKVDFNDLRILSRIAILKAVAVHENAAYTWDEELKSMIVGTIEGDIFHWKSLETDVPIAMRSDDIKIVYSSTSTFTTIVANGHVGPNLVICQLNLITMKWERFCTPHREEFKIIRYIWKLNGIVHMLCNDKAKQQFHLVIDTDKKEIQLIAVPKLYSTCKRCFISKHFIHDNKLYKFRQSATGNCLLLRYNDDRNEWQKLFELGANFPKNICACNAEVTVLGSRVFVLTANSRFALRKLYVVEMAPTLFDHAFAAVLRNSRLKTVGEDVLPDFLTNNLYRDISGDSLVKERRRETMGERHARFSAILRYFN